MTLSRCRNIADLRMLARRRLPAPMWHYMDGGADDERSLARNTAAFADYDLIPRYLVDVGEISLKTRLLGCDLDLPFFLAPTGMSRLFHHDKEPGVARAAARFGTLYSLSTVATTSIEEVARASDGPKMFQVYVHKDRGLTREFVARCKAAGYAALCLTVDMPVAGNRERDLKTGMTLPPRFGPRSLLSFAAHPRWTWHLVRQPDFALANVSHRIAAKDVSLMSYVNAQFDRGVNWDDAAWLAGEWGGPLVIKGLLSAEDARHAADIGAAAVMVSNHGGRQLDGAIAPIDCIAPLRAAVGDRLALILDGGVRRGSHVLTALALGADAVSIGRAYLYGLAAGGEAGVERALAILKAEMERAMALIGARTIADIRPEMIKGRKP
ncbi:MAG: alpha-hydroxy acid oxidase [Pseudomonadota bacterium]